MCKHSEASCSGLDLTCIEIERLSFYQLVSVREGFTHVAAPIYSASA